MRRLTSSFDILERGKGNGVSHRNRRDGAAFVTAPLEAMVAIGRLAPDRARIWFRAHAPGEVRVLWRPERSASPWEEARGTFPSGADGDLTGIADLGDGAALAPGTRYEYRVLHESGRELGSGAFETPPDHRGPMRIRVGLLSCHQPFDGRGRLRADAVAMLTAMLRHFEAQRPDMVFTVGDQMYTDAPSALSIFRRKHFRTIAPPGRHQITDCSPEEVRRLLGERYRIFWNVPGWQELHARYPCYPMLDDHEMVDNWGSLPAHQQPEWRAFELGARRAYMDYQGSRVLDCSGSLPGNFSYIIDHGPLSAFVTDLRSERRAGPNGRLISDEQEEALRNFLETRSDRGVALIVFTVPIVHLPRAIAQGATRLAPFFGDFADRWSTGAHRLNRDRVLRILYEHHLRHPRQRVVLLSGDIHIACAHAIEWGKERPWPLYQFVSSGVTHRSTRVVYLASEGLIRMNRHVTLCDGMRLPVKLVSGSVSAHRNPCGGLNMGTLEVDATEDPSSPRIRFLIHGHRGEHTVCRFESPWL